MTKQRVHHTQKEHQTFLIAAWLLHTGKGLRWTKALMAINELAEPGLKLGKGTIYTNSKKWLKEAESLPLPVDTLENPSESTSEPLTAPAEISLEDKLSDLADHIVDQLFPKIVEKLLAKLESQQWAVPTQQNFPKVTNVKKSLPRILIVGLLPVQQQEVSKAYKNIFNLHYQESDENIQRLEARVNWSDIVILNCTKISHKHQDVVKKYAGSKQVKLVFGGVSSIKGELEGIKTKCLTM